MPAILLMLCAILFFAFNIELILLTIFTISMVPVDFRPAFQAINRGVNIAAEALYLAGSVWLLIALIRLRIARKSRPPALGGQN